MLPSLNRFNNHTLKAPKNKERNEKSRRRRPGGWGRGCKERKRVGLLSGTDRAKNKPRFEREREREGGRENLNSKTLFYERERERQTDRQTETETERDRQRQRQRDRDRETDRQKDRQTDRQRQRVRQRQRDRDRETDR